MGGEGIRDPGCGVSGDGVVLGEARGAACCGVADIKAADEGAHSRDGGGGDEGGVEQEEAKRRARIITMEGAEWAGVVAGVGDGVVVDLKEEMKKVSERIRDLKKVKGPSEGDKEELQKLILRMNEIRGCFNAKKKRGPPTPEPHHAKKPAIPSSPVTVHTTIPLHKRSAFTAMGHEALLRASCNHDHSNTILDIMMARHRGVKPPSTPYTGDCETCQINTATYHLVNGEFQLAKETLSSMGTTSLFSLTKGMVSEASHDPEEEWTRLYEDSVARSSWVGLTYFGVFKREEHSLPLSVFKDFRITGAEEVQHRDMLALLKLVCFDKRGLPAYPSACPSAEMQANNHVCVRHLLNPEIVGLLAAHYSDLIDGGKVTFGDRRTARYFAYNDPLARLVMSQLTQYIEELVGHQVKPSYSYMISYRDASELVPHQDREQAEIVVSIQLSMYPSCDIWPLCIGTTPQPPKRGDAPRPPPSETASHILYNGDAVIFRGRVMVHWRDPIPPGTETTMLLVHYVHADFDGSLKTGFND
eukprot:TRINITY_DN10282_c0_g3_i1.p1 TRINITY_DN10282_c0_g3~~TRINITY_DN10282_c0_g3_i1.p1  ORF type:complete len:530 (+),score=111.10 TRINITY_DN10282_c0_g3_i1:60-1649(+)